MRIAALLLALLPLAVHAQEAQPESPLVECPKHTTWTQLVGALTNARLEVRGRGLSHDGTATLMFTDGDGTEWSSVSVRADGQACIFDHGKDWVTLGQPGTAS